MLRVLDLLYLMLPAYLANMAPPFVKFWHGWNRPISTRLLGDHKTVVGFSLGVVVAVVTVYAQARAGWGESLIVRENWLLIGLAFGLGAMGGDSLKSLFKRAVGIAPGRSWVPADQLDFVIGALILVWPWVNLTWSDVAIILIISFAGDIAVNHLSYRLGVRDTRW
jgi:CDP-2,3-bis-(O-geranylgeranyl)-sn-glycerol synthase